MGGDFSKRSGETSRADYPENLTPPEARLLWEESSAMLRHAQLA